MLDEYKDLPNEELSQMLREERRKLLNLDSRPLNPKVSLNLLDSVLEKSSQMCVHLVLRASSTKLI